MDELIDQIDKQIEDTLVMDDYDGGYVAGLHKAKTLLEKAQDQGPRYFGYKGHDDTPLN
jgi:hypothetical protein